MNDRYWRLESLATDIGDWSHERQILLEPLATDTGDWSHEQLILELLPEPRTTKPILEPQTIDRYWRLEPQATDTGATDTEDWSRKQQILEPQATTNGATNDRRYRSQHKRATGATGAMNDGATSDNRYRTTGATNDWRYWSHRQEQQTLDTGGATTTTTRATGVTSDRQILEAGATAGLDDRYWRRHKRQVQELLPEPRQTTEDTDTTGVQEP